MAKRKRLTKKQREQRRKLTIGLVLAAVVFVVGYLFGREDVDFGDVRRRLDEATARIEQRVGELDFTSTPPSEAAEGTSQIHILDVGQGSAILMIGSDGTSVLVDTGRYDDGEKRIISYLDHYIGLGEELDLLVFTHNDSDHIGHGDLVLEYFDVQEVWMSGLDHTTQVYADVLDAILASDAKYREPKAGEFFERGAFDIDVLHPVEGHPASNQNDESIVMHVAFDGLSLMTSGDVSTSHENDIIERSGSLHADLLILGHHGADNSTGMKWLEAVRPEMAFYQAGANNSYGHPSPETLERLKKHGVPTYGTIELGTISIYLDENQEVTVETERGS